MSMKTYRIEWLEGDDERHCNATIAARSSMLALDEWGRRMHDEGRGGVVLLCVCEI